MRKPNTEEEWLRSRIQQAEREDAVDVPPLRDAEVGAEAGRSDPNRGSSQDWLDWL